MSYVFERTTIAKHCYFFDAYLQQLCAGDKAGISSREDYWEDHLLASQFYALFVSGEEVGLAAIYQHSLLTCFYLPRQHMHVAQPLFTAFQAEHPFTHAYVLTHDELLLSLALEVAQSVELQAYLFVYDSTAVRSPEFPRALLRLAIPEDQSDILDTEHVLENIALGKYYVMRENGVFMGQGFFNRSTLDPSRVSIGMSVHPDYRQRGVGRSIIMHLAHEAMEQGLQPYCGCWSGNANSKRTLESAGFRSATRLLLITFPPVLSAK